MSGAPWVGLSLMPTDDFRRAALPLFSQGLVEGLQWSFDMGSEVAWSVPLLDAYEEAGRLSGHGVHLGILSGSWSERQAHWLRDMAACTRARRYTRVSEHWGFTTAGDFQSGAPLPVPFSTATLSLGQDRMQHFASAAQTQVGLENLAFAFSAVDALVHGSFLDGLLRDIDGYVVLDLHNLYCQTQNFDIDPVVLIESYPLDLVKELHLSGGSTSPARGRASVRRDTHDDAVPDAVFEMAELALLRCPNVESIILERLGGTIASEAAAEIFRLDFQRVLDLRNQIRCSDLVDDISGVDTRPPQGHSPTGNEVVDHTPEDAATLPLVHDTPMTDPALAAFQARLLTTFDALSGFSEILAALRSAPECLEYLSYIDTFDADMVEVAALLTKKWAKRQQ